MKFKLLFSKEIADNLNSFKGRLKVFYSPNDDEEKYAYVEFNDREEISKFDIHFGKLLVMLDNLKEWPEDNPERIQLFTKAVRA